VLIGSVSGDGFFINFFDHFLDFFNLFLNFIIGRFILIG